VPFRAIQERNVGHPGLAFIRCGLAGLGDRKLGSLLTLLFRQDEFVAAGELKSVLFAAMANDQLPLSGEQFLTRHDSRFVFIYPTLAL
jgi:hypothetical protein